MLKAKFFYAIVASITRSFTFAGGSAAAPGILPRYQSLGYRCNFHAIESMRQQLQLQCKFRRSRRLLFPGRRLPARENRVPLCVLCVSVVNKMIFSSERVTFSRFTPHASRFTHHAFLTMGSPH
jgi:hypothetical protein